MPKKTKQSASAWDSIQAMLEQVMERRIARSRRVVSSVSPADSTDSEPTETQIEEKRFKERMRRNRATR